MRKAIAIVLIILSLTSLGLANETGFKNVFSQGIIEGYFIGYDQGRILIEEYGGAIYSLPSLRNVQFQIDNRPVKITDFHRGMEVYGELQGRSIKYMDAFSNNNPGYIPAGGKVRTGTVKEIDRDQIQIVSATGKEESYFTSPATLVLKNNQNTSMASLYTGDQVKLYFDDINSSYISRLEIQGDSVLIKDLYRGKIGLVDQLEDVILLENVDVFRNGSWKSLGSSFKLAFNGDLPIYIGGQELKQNQLQYYRGKTAYMAIKDYFGQDRIEKMVIKSQYERSYSDKIEEINWFGSQLELANKQNINFNQGTMVIKNGRLVDIYNLNPGSDGLIIADGRAGDLLADLIYVYNEDINNSNIGQDQIYAGRLNTIVEDRVYLKDFFLLDKNTWLSFREEKELFYDHDTFIYNMEEGKEVSAKEFFSSDFSVDEGSGNTGYKRDWHGYLYTEGDRIAAVYMKKSLDPLLLQRTTTGIVETKPTDNPNMGWTMKVRDAKDWSSKYQEWLVKNASLDIYLREAMIIKNGKKVEIEDIELGDRLYLVRDSNMAKIIIIK